MTLQIADILTLPIPTVQEAELFGGVQAFGIQCNAINPIVIQLQFKGGRTRENAKLAGLVTNAVVKEGSQNLDAIALAEAIENLGGSISYSFYLDAATISIRCLSKHLQPMLDLVRDVLINPRFDEQDIELFVENQKQELSIDLSHTESVAFREYTRLLFGDDHPYGYNSSHALYDRIDRSTLIAQYEQQFRASLCEVLVMAHDPQPVFRYLDQQVLPYLPSGSSKPFRSTIIDAPKRLDLTLSEAEQHSVRLGGHCMVRSDSDYTAFLLLIYVLGGYYGSRLIKKIREDQGLSYHILSQVDTLRLHGFYSIHAETSQEHVAKVIAAVHHEIDVLQNDLITDHELKMVKNYLMGNYSRWVDDPLKQIRFLSYLRIEGLDFRALQQHCQTLVELNKEQIRTAAGQYLIVKNMTTVTVG